MAYTKTLWKTGDIVTQEKMNKIEQGIKSMELPAVTTNDNGKSLVVENGAWALGNVTPAEPEQENNIFVLEATQTDAQTFSTTMTWSELDQARLDGRRVFLQINNPDGTISLVISNPSWVLPANLVFFERLYTSGSTGLGSIGYIHLQHFDVSKSSDSDALTISYTFVTKNIGLVGANGDGLMSVTDKQHLDELYEDYIGRQGN